MKVKLMSDLHTEFWDNGWNIVDPGTGEVLILAGDIGVVSTLGTPDGKAYEDFLRRCSEGYDKVFYVMGNHELYSGCFIGTPVVLLDFLYDYKNITLLDDNSEFYNGVHFVGGTMWSNFGNMNASVMETCHKMMNDYNFIKNQSNPLTPTDVLIRHKDTTEWFDRCVGSLRGPVVMITHHAPSQQSVQTPFESDGAYYTDMSRFIKSHPHIVNWCHGHLHATNDYKVHQCRVMSNSYGYDNYKTNQEFSNVCEFSVG